MRNYRKSIVTLGMESFARWQHYSVDVSSLFIFHCWWK